MVPLDYLVLRLVRRHLPRRVVRLMLEHRIVIKPGLETLAPAEAAQRFLRTIHDAGDTVVGRRILIFGYGGRFGVGSALLQAGARHVVLLDPYAKPSRAANLALAKSGSPSLTVSRAKAVPDPDRLTVVSAPLRAYLAGAGEPADLVLSNSVLEHVEDLAGTVADLASVTASGGQQVHFIDLRDHYFKHPFEMLCHSDKVWRKFLNPGSNLNRLRAWDYERIFCRRFPKVSVEPLGSDLAAFHAARPRIRPEFLSGDEVRDAWTRILLRASFA